MGKRSDYGNIGFFPMEERKKEKKSFYKLYSSIQVQHFLNKSVEKLRNFDGLKLCNYAQGRASWNTLLYTSNFETRVAGA